MGHNRYPQTPQVEPFMLNGRTIRECYQKSDSEFVIEFTDGHKVKFECDITPNGLNCEIQIKKAH